MSIKTIEAFDAKIWTCSFVKSMSWMQIFWIYRSLVSQWVSSSVFSCIWGRFPKWEVSQPCHTDLYPNLANGFICLVMVIQWIPCGFMCFTHVLQCCATGTRAPMTPKQRSIAWAHVNWGLCRHIASRGQNDLMLYIADLNCLNLGPSAGLMPAECLRRFSYPKCVNIASAMIRFSRGNHCVECNWRYFACDYSSMLLWK